MSELRRIGLDDLREERLALAEATRNVFATPELHETWWRHFGKGRELLLHAILDGAELVGLLPLYRLRGGVLRFLGHGGGDELGPVALPGREQEVADALGRLGARLVVADHVPPVWARILSSRTLRSERSPVVQVAAFESWDAYLATRSSNFRQQVRSRPRRLAREHEVVVRTGDLDTLFRLHRERWPDGSEFARHEAFHRSFAAVARERGWADLLVLEVEGAPAAAWYGFRFAGVDSYYQSGRDPARDRDSVGLVLLAHTVERAFADGRDEYRFLRGDEPYKFRFTDDEARVETVAIGPAAPAAAAGVRALLATRAAARRLARSARRARAADALRPDA